MARQPRNGFGLDGKPADRQLVAADVERANDDRRAVERLDHALVRAILLLLVGHVRAADDEKLRAHEPDAIGAAAHCGFRLFRKVDVGAQHQSLAVERDRLDAPQELELARRARASRCERSL